MTLPIYVVDAFAAARFAGNPAAVCPLDAWLPDATLQSIAAENNLSETAFFLRAGDGFDLRWFTPTVEVDLCGHATLAAAYVITEYLEPQIEDVTFNTRSGVLRVSREGGLLVLELPARPPQPSDLGELVAGALGVGPQAVLQAGKFMAVLANESEVRDAAPDLAKVAGLPGDGLIITARGEDCDIVSRYFAPHAGIPEDPVTGSAHCLLVPYWAMQLDRADLTARQLSARGGELQCRLRGDRVLLGGRVVPYLEGRILV